VFFKVFCGIEHRAGFEQGDRNTQVGEDLGDSAAARARADNDDIINGGTPDDLHGY